MKKNLITLCALIIAAAMTVSCGSSKSALESQNAQLLQAMYAQQQQQQSGMAVETEVAISECEQMSFDMSDGKLRAYGTASDIDRDFARQIAAANAKGQMSSDMTSLVKNVLRNYRSKVGVAESTKSQANIEQEIEVIAENLINNVTILKSAIYNRNDGTVRYEVCIGSVDMPEKIVEQLIQNEEELKTKYNQKLFKESYQEGLMEFKRLKASQN